MGQWDPLTNEMTAYRFSKPWNVCFNGLNYFGRIAEFSGELRFDFLGKFRMNGE